MERKKLNALQPALTGAVTQTNSCQMLKVFYNLLLISWLLSLYVLLSLTSAALTPSYFMFQLLCCESEMKLISVLIFHTHTLLADGLGVSVMDRGDGTRPEQWRRLWTRALLFSAWVESQTSLLESLQ